MKVNREKLTTIPLFITAFLFFGCNKFQSAPPPDLPLQNLMPEVKPSVTNLNITLKLDEIFQDIEKSIPKDNREGEWEEIPEPGSGKGVLFIWRRDPLNISMKGNSLVIKTTINYKLSTVTK
jgi:hypothetical protein